MSTEKAAGEVSGDPTKESTTCSYVYKCNKSPDCLPPNLCTDCTLLRCKTGCPASTCPSCIFSPTCCSLSALIECSKPSSCSPSSCTPSPLCAPKCPPSPLCSPKCPPPPCCPTECPPSPLCRPVRKPCPCSPRLPRSPSCGPACPAPDPCCPTSTPPCLPMPPPWCTVPPRCPRCCEVTCYSKPVLSKRDPCCPPSPCCQPKCPPPCCPSSPCCQPKCPPPCCPPSPCCQPKCPPPCCPSSPCCPPKNCCPTKCPSTCCSPKCPPPCCPPSPCCPPKPCCPPQCLSPCCPPQCPSPCCPPQCPPPFCPPCPEPPSAHRCPMAVEGERPRCYTEHTSSPFTWENLGVRIIWTDPAAPGTATVCSDEQILLKLCVEVKPSTGLTADAIGAFCWTPMRTMCNPCGTWKDIPLLHQPHASSTDANGVARYVYSLTLTPTADDTAKLTFNVRWCDVLVWANNTWDAPKN